MNFDQEFLDAAHARCFGNEPEVRESGSACCIACAKSFPAMLATEVVEQRNHEIPTVLCPVCEFDTVIGDRSGYPVGEVQFIAAMNRQYCKEPLDTGEAWKELLDAKN